MQLRKKCSTEKRPGLGCFHNACRDPYFLYSFPTWASSCLQATSSDLFLMNESQHKWRRFLLIWGYKRLWLPSCWHSPLLSGSLCTSALIQSAVCHMQGPTGKVTRATSVQHVSMRMLVVVLWGSRDAPRSAVLWEHSLCRYQDGTWWDPGIENPAECHLDSWPTETMR